MNARFVDGGSQLNSVLVFLTEVKNAEGVSVEHFFLNMAGGDEVSLVRYEITDSSEFPF